MAQWVENLSAAAQVTAEVQVCSPASTVIKGSSITAALTWVKVVVLI